MNQTRTIVVTLGSPADESEIAALRRRNYPHGLTEWATCKRSISEYEDTLVARFPSGELAASIMVGVARTPEELKRQLGVSLAFKEADLPILTTSHSCSVEKRYLDMLLSVVLHIAQFTKIDGKSFAWQMSSCNRAHSADRDLLDRLGYTSFEADSLVASQIAVALHSMHFRSAYGMLYDMLGGELPSYEYEGKLAFQDRRDIQRL
ncbi:MAG: hypothetical protein ABI605_12860 [Rhizobacter sp.]